MISILCVCVRVWASARLSFAFLSVRHIFHFMPSCSSCSCQHGEIKTNRAKFSNISRYTKKCLWQWASRGFGVHPSHVSPPPPRLSRIWGNNVKVKVCLVVCAEARTRIKGSKSWIINNITDEEIIFKHRPEQPLSFNWAQKKKASHTWKPVSRTSVWSATDVERNPSSFRSLSPRSHVPFALNPS